MTGNPDIVKNWILKARNDFKTGKDEMETMEPATDTICFHMQQYVEKYLKGYLVYHQNVQKINSKLKYSRCFCVYHFFHI